MQCRLILSKYVNYDSCEALVVKLFGSALGANHKPKAWIILLVYLEIVYFAIGLVVDLCLGIGNMF